MNANEAFVLVAAIIAGAIVLTALFRYSAQVVRSGRGASTGSAEGEEAGGDALTQGEIEGMIRRAVREEVREAMQPLREQVERIETRSSGEQPSEKAPRRDLPAGRFEEDPHGFGLIAEGPGESQATDAA